MSVQDRIAKIRSLMKQRGYDALVLRNNADLRWLTGAARVFDFENAHTAFITQNDLFFHTDSRYYNTFLEALGPDTPWKFDMDLCGMGSWVARHALQAHVASGVVCVEDTITLAQASELRRAFEDRSLAPRFAQLHDDIIKLRAVKDDEEIELMRRAQKVTDEAFTYMCGIIRPGLTEMELRVELDNYMLSHGGDALAFDTILAGGPNSANPHARPGARMVQEGDFVLMDYGAGLGDYRSDMTRTVVVGQPSPKQLEIYNTVRRAHEACAAAIRPGVKCREVHELAVKIIAEAGYGDYFAHGLGHGVGIDIHELPRTSRTTTDVYEPGMVCTVEPGIYLPGWGGVRLEDYGVVTEEGFEPFTASTHDLIVIDL